MSGRDGQNFEATLPERRRLLLVHAHPDDETLTTGGTIARYATDGTEVCVVTCTLGEEGEIIPPELGQLAASDADQLGGYRAGELAGALAALGVRAHRYLGGIGHWRDSGMAGTPVTPGTPDGPASQGHPGSITSPIRPLGRTSGPPSLGRAGQPPSAEHPKAFVRGGVEEQADQLRALIDEFRPQVVVGYDSFGGYGHPDHIRAHEITMAAAPGARSVRRVYHVVAPRTAVHGSLAALRAAGDVPFTVPDDADVPTVPDDRVHTVIEIGPYLDVKLTALEAHLTQVSVWRGSTPCFALSNGFALPNPGAEYFELAYGEAAGSANDLFGGIGEA